MPVDRLTESVVKSLPSPEEGTVITWDTETKGFGCRITAKGVRSFIFDYRPAGSRRQRQHTIGRHPDWSVHAARTEARRLKQEANTGKDPQGERQALRHAPTVADLFERYDREHLPTKEARSAADDRSMWRNYVLPELGPVRVNDVTHSDVDRLHTKVTNASGPTRANHVIGVVRKAMNLAIRWEWRRGVNPCAGVKLNRSEPRHYFLSEEQAGVVWSALSRCQDQRSANVLRLLMLTGARKGETLAATWDQFDLDYQLWVKPSAHTKQRREHRVPLNDEAVALLRRIKAEGRPERFVFPSRSTDQAVRDIRRTWDTLRNQLGLGSVRIHDLRHTFASLAINDGATLQEVGDLLGHTQSQTTMVYAHVFQDRKARVAGRVGKLIVGGAIANLPKAAE